MFDAYVRTVEYAFLIDINTLNPELNGNYFAHSILNAFFK